MLIAHSSLYGTHLTHKQCCSEYKSMLNFDADSDIFERGSSDIQTMAKKNAYHARPLSECTDSALPEKLLNRDKDYEVLESERRRQEQIFHPEGRTPNEDNFEKLLQMRHIRPEPTPYWDLCVNRTDTLLNTR